MEQTLLAVVLVVGLLLALPFIINARHQRKKKEILKHDLLSYVEQVNGSADYLSCTQQFAIAMDESKLVLYFLWHERPHIVKEVSIATLREVSLDVASLKGDGGQRKISRVSLKLLPAAKSEPTELWVFYDAHDKLQINNELLLAEEWKGRIASFIKR